jgi:hypothetical protein
VCGCGAPVFFLFQYMATVILSVGLLVAHGDILKLQWSVVRAACSCPHCVGTPWIEMVFACSCPPSCSDRYKGWIKYCMHERGAQNAASAGMCTAPQCARIAGGSGSYFKDRFGVCWRMILLIIAKFSKIDLTRLLEMPFAPVLNRYFFFFNEWLQAV